MDQWRSVTKDTNPSAPYPTKTRATQHNPSPDIFLPSLFPAPINFIYHVWQLLHSFPAMAPSCGFSCRASTRWDFQYSNISTPKQMTWVAKPAPRSIPGGGVSADLKEGVPDKTLDIDFRLLFLQRAKGCLIQGLRVK